MRNMCGTIFYIKTNVLQDFHICMNVPLIKNFIFCAVDIPIVHAQSMLRGVFGTQQKIYDRAFFAKIVSGFKTFVIFSKILQNG